MRLLGVELDRFFSRSAIQWLVVATFLLGGLGALLALGPATPMSEAERANAVADFESYHEHWLAESQGMYEECLASEAAEREIDPEVDWGCEWALEEPQLSDWLWETTFAQAGAGIVLGLVTAILLVVLVAAVTFVSAEFSTGAISNWLTFEPRRTRVFFSKLGAAVVGVAPLVAAGYAVALGATWAPFALQGTAGEMTATTWGEYAALGGRVVLAGALVAVVGVALAFFLRHLAAAIGVSVGWLVIVEQLGSLAYPSLQRWTFGNNLRALIEGGATYYLDVCTFDEAGRRTCEWTELAISTWQGGLTIAVFAAVLAVLALLVFRRRDVL